MFIRTRFSRHLALAVAAAIFTIASMNALAGAFNETDEVAIGGFDPVAYMSEQKALAGSAEFTSVYKGSTFRFQSAANRDAFAASPEKFAPQYDGYCAFGVSRGYKAVTAPDAFTVVNGKLYLNYNAEVKAMWSKDVPGYIGKADRNWATVEKTTKIHR